LLGLVPDVWPLKQWNNQVLGQIEDVQRCADVSLHGSPSSGPNEYGRSGYRSLARRPGPIVIEHIRLPGWMRLQYASAAHSKRTIGPDDPRSTCQRLMRRLLRAGFTPMVRARCSRGTGRPQSRVRRLWRRVADRSRAVPMPAACPARPSGVVVVILMRAAGNVCMPRR
jgi:hypothetical protein